MKKTLSVLVFILCLGYALPAPAMPINDVPNPQTSGGIYVQDSAGVLGSSYVALIDGVAKKLKSATGTELAVVTVDNLDGLTVEDYAERLFKRFGIGTKEKDHGLLILFSLADRKVRIEVGYGLEGIMNDAKTGRLLDTYAVPKFKEGLYGQGLYDTAAALAHGVATGQGASLALDTPTAWPAQVEPPKPSPADTKSEATLDPYTAVAGYAVIMLGITIGGLLLLSGRIRMKKAKAAKVKALGHGTLLPVFVWIVGAIVMFMLGNLVHAVLMPLLGFIVIAALATILQIKVRRRLKRYIADYHLPCPSCGHRMALIEESADDQYLTPEEAAEEKVGGMDYEFWRCEPCDKRVRLAVKIGKASKCPKCAHLTLTTVVSTLQAATTTTKGRERVQHVCHNPKCNYRNEFERSIAKKSSSSSRSSSGGGSSGGSFSGGSSGGGGSSRGW